MDCLKRSSAVEVGANSCHTSSRTPVSSRRPRKDVTSRPQVYCALKLAFTLVVCSVLVAACSPSTAPQEAGRPNETSAPESDDVSPATDSSTGDSPIEYTTSEQALTAAMADESVDMLDFDYVLYAEHANVAIYWLTHPDVPNAALFVLLKDDGGSWTWALDGAYIGVTPDDSIAATLLTMQEYLLALQKSRKSDAAALTIEPFSTGAAGSGYSGQLTDYRVQSANVLLGTSDQTWAQTVETRSGVESHWKYRLVPTDTGYRIVEVAESGGNYTW